MQTTSNEENNATGRHENLLQKFSAAAKNASIVESAVERLCIAHRDRTGAYFCYNCQVWRCKECARTFEGVAVCQDCDGLSVSAARFDEQQSERHESEKPFSYHLARSLTFPFRHYLLTAGLWLAVWSLALAIDSFIYGSDAPGFLKLLAGPFSFGVSAVVAYAILGVAMTACLVSRANGREGWVTGPVDNITELAEPAGLWIGAAIIGLAPIVIYLGYHKLQIIIVLIITGGDYTHILAPPPSIRRSVMTVFWSLWAFFFYPMGLVVAASQRSILAVLNPLAALSAWITLRAYLVRSLVLMFTLAAAAAGLIYWIRNLPFGFALAAGVATVASLAISQILGVAVFKGLEHVPADQVVRISLSRFWPRRGQR